jgi:transcriptional regulator with XRE-family HTH domain
MCLLGEVVASRDRQPNELLRKARGPLSQATLADRVNAEIYRATGRVAVITSKSISDWERGWYRWPTADVRAALCRILGVATPAELGFFKQRARRAENPLRDVISLRDSLDSRELVPIGAIEALNVPAGRSFAGVEVVAHHCAAEKAGDEWLIVDPGTDLVESLRRADRRSLVVAVDRDRKYYVSDGRRFAGRADRRTGPQPVPSANVIDDLTVGIIWAITNTDIALLADDAQLDRYQARLAHYEERSGSEAMLSEVPSLNAVSSRWLGSRFCARHITRHLELLTGAPLFWTREQRGEEAASWLIWSHKYEYLRRTSRWFVGMRRGFCVPESEVAASPRYERVLLLLAMALMEAFGIRVEVSSESELGCIEGFVVADEAIVADWLRASGLWYVDVGAPPSRQSSYRDIAGHLAAESVTDRATPVGRLEAIAEYLNVPWGWFRMRCEELAAAGVDDIAHPRSRLLSTRGLNTAIRYVAYINDLEGADLARR